MLRNFWVAAQLASSQEVLSSLQLLFTVKMSRDELYVSSCMVFWKRVCWQVVTNSIRWWQPGIFFICSLFKDAVITRLVLEGPKLKKKNACTSQLTRKSKFLLSCLQWFTKLFNVNQLGHKTQANEHSSVPDVWCRRLAMSVLHLEITFCTRRARRTLNSLCQALRVVIKEAALISAIRRRENCYCFPLRKEKCRYVANDAQVQGRSAPATLNWLPPRQREPTGACGPHKPHKLLQPVYFVEYLLTIR
jgi:hypothetical protein